jgi:hypothetical protein
MVQPLDQAAVVADHIEKRITKLLILGDAVRRTRNSGQLSFPAARFTHASDDCIKCWILGIGVFPAEPKWHVKAILPDLPQAVVSELAGNGIPTFPFWRHRDRKTPPFRINEWFPLNCYGLPEKARVSTSIDLPRPHGNIDISVSALPFHVH